MSNIDLTPLYRTMVGFDRMATMIDTASRLDGTQGYPPYNIERSGENAFAIEIAVAGKKGENEDGDGREYLHRGIAQRSFIRRFQLADHVIVTGARLDHGVLRVDLVRELPEEKKPRKIAIGSHTEASEPRLIGKKAAGNAA